MLGLISVMDMTVCERGTGPFDKGVLGLAPVTLLGWQSRTGQNTNTLP